MIDHKEEKKGKKWRIGKRWLLISIVAVISILGGAIISSVYFTSKKPELVLATTTSVYDSGLLNEILPDFESEYGIKVKVLAVGSGQAMEYGRRGDADVLFVHSPKDEIEFVNKGYGLYRKTLLWNTFFILGPKDTNPANLNDTDKAKSAFLKIYDARAYFASRADNSGTHTKELGIWKSANISQAQLNATSWYLRCGQGMGETLTFAAQKGAYTLTDEGTWYSMENNLGNLKVYVNNDTELQNFYSVIPVNPSMHPNIYTDGATKFVNWLTSSETLERIGGFKVNGHALFRIYGG